MGLYSYMLQTTTLPGTKKLQPITMALYHVSNYQTKTMDGTNFFYKANRGGLRYKGTGASALKKKSKIPWSPKISFCIFPLPQEFFYIEPQVKFPGSASQPSTDPPCAGFSNTKPAHLWWSRSAISSQRPHPNVCNTAPHYQNHN